MNHLAAFSQLKNRYFVMRHGRSLANESGLIVSSPQRGIDGYGLSDEGRRQVRQRLVANTSSQFTVSRIMSSDFKRARETAEMAHEWFEVSHSLTLKPQLRERFFGDFEHTGVTHYQTVWDDDAISAEHTNHGVESANSVMERASGLVRSLEKAYRGEGILLVSHGDTLQILQTAFEKVSASVHRSMAHMDTAEIRELVLGQNQAE